MHSGGFLRGDYKHPLANLHVQDKQFSRKGVKDHGLYRTIERCSFQSYVADGHHYYTTALESQLDIEDTCLRDLDVVILSDLIVKKNFGLDYERCENENLVHYYSDIDEAVDVAVKDCVLREDRTPLLFLMNPTRVDQVRKVVDAGQNMPHKSTYFYPKIMTGLMFYEMAEGEEINRLG